MGDGGTISLEKFDVNRRDNDEVVRPLTKRRKAIQPQPANQLSISAVRSGQQYNPIRKQISDVENIIRDLYISRMHPSKIADMINKFNLAANLAVPKWSEKMIENLIKTLGLIR